MNLFDLYAKITLDTSGYEEGMDDASNKTEGFASKLKTGLATAAKVGTAALTAASGAVVALTKSAVDNYAEYEQLVGGVDTLFKQSADAVMSYAENAYKTAGMSANEYMETVTSFSASLLQSLDGDTTAAAEKADLAITDMADNANKMGSSMESIQNAYSGFAKSNFTMLDNLKLGYGGTKEEMQRLLEDAEKVSGIEYDISSYADIVDAIHVVQTEMGITGTTALEASTTIQGSLSSMKSAWENLVTGLGDENADLDTLIGNLVTSAETALGNLIPRITQILSGMGSAIEQLAPILAAEIPTLLTSVLPSVISAGAQLLVGLVTGVISALPSLVSAIPEIIVTVVDAISASLPALQAAGGELVGMLSGGILTGVPTLIAELPTLITAIIGFLGENLPKWVEAGGDFIGELLFGIIDAIPDLIGGLPEVIRAMTDYFTEEFPTFVKKGGELLGKLLVGVIGAIPEIAVQIPEVISAIDDALSAGWDTLKEAGKYLLEGLWAGISDKVEWLKGKVTGVVDTIKGWFTGSDGFDEHSPSKWAKTVGEYMMQGLAIGLENGKGEVMETAADIIDEVKSRFNTLSDALTLRQDVGDLDYKLWERTEGKNATETEKYEKQLELLNKQQTDQQSVVEAAASAYAAMVTQYGENSAESYEYQKTLLNEMLAYQDLLDKIEEVIAAKEALGNIDTETVRFEDSATAKTSEATINAMSSAAENSANVTLNATLVTPEGTKLANYYLPSFIKAAAAAGTPIANPQTA